MNYLSILIASLICFGIFVGLRNAEETTTSIDLISIEEEDPDYLYDDYYGQDLARKYQLSEIQHSPAPAAFGLGSNTNGTSSNFSHDRLYIPENYNRLEIPSISKVFPNIAWEDPETVSKALISGELRARVQLKIHEIRDIDELNGQITVELDFLVKWVDFVILFNGSSYSDVDPSKVLQVIKQSDIGNVTEESIRKGSFNLEPSFLTKLWKPDIFIENVISINRPALMSKPVRVRFHKKGIIQYSSRLTLKVNCQMDFKYFPADTQHCLFKLRSYSYASKFLGVGWDQDRPGVYLYERKDPNFDVKLSSMGVSEFSDQDLLGLNETFNVLEFTISARRKISFHMVQTFIPSIFFIIITWLCFLIPSRMVEARIGISMTTLLSLTSMFSSSRETSPKVSYVKAIDIWMVACIFFVFLTLLEFTVLVWLRYLKEAFEERQAGRKRGKLEQVPENERLKREILEIPKKSRKFGAHWRQESIATVRFRQKVSLAEKIADPIENYSFVVFSILFVVFNAIYWPWLITASNYLNWTVDYSLNFMDESD